LFILSNPLSDVNDFFPVFSSTRFHRRLNILANLPAPVNCFLTASSWSRAFRRLTILTDCSPSVNYFLPVNVFSYTNVLFRSFSPALKEGLWEMPVFPRH
jgi:hypothetical protein